MQPDLPWSGRSPQAKHCSYLAAVRAANDRSRKSARYLAWLQTVESATDHEAARKFPTWPMSSICSIRYRRMAREQHPDAGGTHEGMARLNEARANARKALAVCV